MMLILIKNLIGGNI